MEIISHLDLPPKAVQGKGKPSATKDYQHANKQLVNIKQAEEEAEVQDFLEQNRIQNSPETRSTLKLILDKGRSFDPQFSLIDLTANQIEEVQKSKHIEVQQKQLDTNTRQAKSAENLVDQWKDEGFSNYEVLQKLLASHEEGTIKLLPEKYANFKQFFSLLTQERFGVADTKRIVEVINQSNVDLTSPEALEVIIFSIYEDDRISTKTKEKIREKFMLFPIVTGDDLKKNLKIKKRQINALERQRASVSETLVSLTGEVKDLKKELEILKETILIEQDTDKRLRLEKKYDELETRLEKLKEEKEFQKKRAKELQEQNITSSVSLRGTKADLKEGEILVTIPGSKTEVSVPDHLSSQAIGKAVNAYLINESLKPFGLESYFFYQSDFNEGEFPHPESLDRNDLFLFRLGFSTGKNILKQPEIDRFKTILAKLMMTNKRSMNLTLHENANKRLSELGLLNKEELNHDKFTEKLIWLKRFQPES